MKKDVWFYSTATDKVVFLSSYFFVYEHGRRAIAAHAPVPGPVAVPLAGGLAGACGWVVSFPLDLVKARIQGALLSAARVHA